MQLKQTSKISLVIITLILLTTNVSSQTEQTKITIYQNETIAITPLQETFCGNTENVFRIERLNYSSTIIPLHINYLQTITLLDEQEPLSGSIAVQKTINKFTTTKTGLLVINTSKMYRISITIEQNELSWLIQGNCSAEEIKKTSNQTTENQTEEAPKQENTEQNNTGLIIENNTNQTTTTPESLISQNNITTNNSSNNTSNETEHQTTTNINNTACIMYAELYLNKEIFFPQEQLQIQFYIKPLVKNFTITYWIEDLQKNIIKKNVTTKNLQIKTHTFKDIAQEEKAYLVKSLIADVCGVHEKQKLVVVKKQEEYIPDEEEELIKTEQLIIEKITLENNKGFASILAQKEDTTKTLVSCQQLSFEGKPLYEEVKFYLLNKHQKTRIIMPLVYSEVPSVLFCEGLNLSASKDIQFLKDEQLQPTTCPLITNTYTRNQYVTVNATWYVRVKGTGNVTIQLRVNKENSTTTIQVKGEETILFPVALLQENNTIQTTLMQNNCQETKIEHVILKEKTSTTNILDNKKIIPLEELVATIHQTNTSNYNPTGYVVIDPSQQQEKNLIFALVIICSLSVLGFLIKKKIKRV